MDKNILKNEKSVNIIYYINEGEIEFVEDKTECIKCLIDLYQEDIYEEFAEYIKRREDINMSLYTYMEEQYSEKYYKLEKYDCFVIDPYCYSNVSEIEDLIELSHSNNIDELINFCEKVEEDVKSIVWDI